MAHAKIKTTIDILDLDGVPFKIEKRYSNTSVNEISIQEFTVSANGTISIWDVSETSEQYGDFDTLIMYANGTLDVEMVIDDGAEVGEELNSFRLVKDLPFILGADDAYANHSAGNIFGGTLDLIEQIRVDEPNGTAVTLKLILVT